MDEVVLKIRLAVEAGKNEEALEIWNRFVLEESQDANRFVEMLTNQPDLHELLIDAINRLSGSRE